MATAASSVQRRDDALAFAGALSREAVPALWPQARRALDGARRFDLSQVASVDSAGLALLVELAQRAGGVAVDGDPPGLDGLRKAYRLSPTLRFAQA